MISGTQALLSGQNLKILFEGYIINQICGTGLDHNLGTMLHDFRYRIVYIVKMSVGPHATYSGDPAMGSVMLGVRRHLLRFREFCAHQPTCELALCTKLNLFEFRGTRNTTAISKVHCVHWILKILPWPFFRLLVPCWFEILTSEQHRHLDVLLLLHLPMQLHL